MKLPFHWTRDALCTQEGFLGANLDFEDGTTDLKNQLYAMERISYSNVGRFHGDTIEPENMPCL
jgi:hypothetical protein